VNCAWRDSPAQTPVPAAAAVIPAAANNARHRALRDCDPSFCDMRYSASLPKQRNPTKTWSRHTLQDVPLTLHFDDLFIQFSNVTTKLLVEIRSLSSTGIGNKLSLHDCLFESGIRLRTYRVVKVVRNRCFENIAREMAHVFAPNTSRKSTTLLVWKNQEVAIIDSVA
jgi:hypothetical protein